MSYFRIIVPIYNSEPYLARALRCIRTQTFKDYHLVTVDDMSFDQKAIKSILKEFKPDAAIYNKTKRFNGGSRNVGCERFKDDLYTLFMDNDDEMPDPETFQKLHDFIEAHGRPDLIRLPYISHWDDTGVESRVKAFGEEKNIVDVAKSGKVAPWTKCIKSELFVPFPENTLFEDVCQHLAQCDVVDTVAFYPDLVIRWHRYSKSASMAQSPKWKSSQWRFVADLMDLELTKPYTKARREAKVAWAIEERKKLNYAKEGI